jgi:hypothetical protein
VFIFNFFPGVAVVVVCVAAGGAAGEALGEEE